MAELKRSAEAVWKGDLRGGNGVFSAKSGVFQDAAYTFATRFENAPGTNPEEMIAAAEAACFSMAFANILSGKGHKPESIHTTATVIMSSKEGGGWRISRVQLDTEGKVPGMDEATFKQVAQDVSQSCPVSTLLKPGLDSIDVTARLQS